jgi:hypothetical protein
MEFEILSSVNSTITINPHPSTTQIILKTKANADNNIFHTALDDLFSGHFVVVIVVVTALLLGIRLRSRSARIATTIL